MDWKELAEKLWENIRDRGYYLAGFLLLVLIPFIFEAPVPKNLPEWLQIWIDLFYPPLPLVVTDDYGIQRFPQMPVLSDIYRIIRSSGLLPPNTYLLKILALCAILAIVAASWDILVGYSGQMSFGHAIFWGLSAYLAFFLSSQYSFLLTDPAFGSILPLDPIIALLLGALASAAFAVLIGIVALRIKGPYLALVTLIIPLIALQIVKNAPPEMTGSEYGMPMIGALIITTNPNREIDALNFFILAIFIFLIAIGILMLIAFSRIGLVLNSIREDEEAAESLGINLSFYKILAFAISAFFAGIAGCLYAQHPMIRVVNPEPFFGSGISFSVIMFVVIGGIGSIIGGVIGAFLLTLLSELFLDSIFPASDVPGFDILVFALILIITLRYLPYGITRATKEQKRAGIAGIMLALAWAIIPSSNNSFGVNLFSEHILPNIEQAGSLLDKFVSISVSTILNLVGKFDMLGIMVGGYDMTYLEGPISAENIVLFLSILIMLIVSIPAILVFLIGEIIGFFILEGLMGLDISGTTIMRAKFLIYTIIGVPFAYYFPKIFKKVRLRYWGVWPSVGRYEPE
ncbi:MAG: branched-chain amino acid ABC transporter permease [Candidatus Hodarchaeales archaeon]|jgi:branched-chain amino acid transport system permease protein